MSRMSGAEGAEGGARHVAATTGATGAEAAGLLRVILGLPLSPPPPRSRPVEPGRGTGAPHGPESPFKKRATERGVEDPVWAENGPKSRFVGLGHRMTPCVWSRPVIGMEVDGPYQH